MCIRDSPNPNPNPNPNQVADLLTRLECYNPAVTKAFNDALGWLGGWACSRSFGLGTWLPWDDQYLIESLSDSTIYMAYYTVAHLLQTEMYGKDRSLVKPEDLTDEVWDLSLIHI